MACRLRFGGLTRPTWDRPAVVDAPQVTNCSCLQGTWMIAPGPGGRESLPLFRRRAVKMFVRAACDKLNAGLSQQQGLKPAGLPHTRTMFGGIRTGSEIIPRSANID
jgi:hypothetical protein